jgi:beta-galactosidase
MWFKILELLYRIVNLENIKPKNILMKKISLIISCMLLWVLQLPAQEKKQGPLHQIALGDSTFLLDGKPFLMISGEIHYPRVPREAWRQRMKMAKAMGLNTIGTYVFWNLHEPQKGYYDFTGNNDIAAFVRIAQEEGLWIILRPSPYVCAEWEYGGYPYWLQNEKGLIVRSTEAAYINTYKKYIKEIGKQLAPLQVNHGGNILMVQIENEYGSYGNDRSYLELNRQLFIEAGFDGLLYTCDPANDVARGYLPGLLPAVNGIDKPSQVKRLVRNYHNGKGPFYIAEWYPAWFDWWGAPHHTVPAEKYTQGLDSVLSAGISINMYMFHGGTTRGFMNGANCKETTPYEPQISSYDYDAPLDEAGNATDKFMKFRKVIEKHLPAGQLLPEVPAPKQVIEIPRVNFTDNISLFDLLQKPKTNIRPLSFEDLRQDYGFVLYRTVVTNASSGILRIKELRDYGIVFLNGKRIAILDRRLKEDSVFITMPRGTVTLDILVENQGRINFGPNLLHNKKGITEAVSLNNIELKGWKMFSLPFANSTISKAGNKAIAADVPVIKKGTFTIEMVGDSYLDLREWGKGMVWINGHNLGKYWSIGPQQTVYVPVEWLKKGKNEIMVLELLKPQENELRGITEPILDKMQKMALSVN